MTDFISMIMSLFTDIVSSLDSFIIIGNISFLRLFFILAIFSIAIKFLFHSKSKE